MVAVSDITRLLPENSANNTSIFLEIEDAAVPLEDVNVLIEGNFDLDGDGINTFTQPIFNFVQQAWEVRIADRAGFDFESPTNNNFSFLIRASDGLTSDLGEIEIILENVNEAPNFQAENFTFAAINATTITPDSIGQPLVASDPEENFLTYEVISGNDPDGNGRGAFTIEQGEIILVNPEELTQDYNLTIAVTDPEGLEDTAQVSIPVFAAPLVEDANLTLDENSAAGTPLPLTDILDDADTAIADLTVTLISGNQDSDGDGSFAFSQPIFNAETGEWELLVNDPDELDFEGDNNPFLAEIQASDGARADFGLLEIALNDINEAPILENISFLPIDGNTGSEFDLVGRIPSLSQDDPDFDPDLEQFLPNFAITGGNDPDGNEINAFTITESGEIRVDNPGELSQDFTLTVTATDPLNADLTATAEIIIPIFADPIVESNEIDLPENSENGTSIPLNIQDANTPLGELIVTILEGNPDADNDGIEVFSAPTFNEESGQWELLVTDSDELNFEQTPFINLTIQASDGEEAGTGFPIVNVTDVNEAPELTVPEFEQPIDANEIVEQFEQAQADAEEQEEDIVFPVVGEITEIEDPDFEQSVSTLAITGGNDPDGNEINAFTINEFNELVVINPLELTQDFTLTITATDDSEDALTSTNELIVPIFADPIVESNTVQFLDRENAEGATETVIPLAISDLDNALSDLTVTITGGNQDNNGDGNFAFSAPTFNEATGQWEILINDADDLNFNNTFELQIQASDGENAGTGIARITLNPDVIGQTVEEFPEDSPEGTAIPLEIEDSDTPLAELEVAIIGGNPDLDEDGRSAFNQPTFNAEAGQWEVTVNDSDDLDFEGVGNFSLNIGASDGEATDDGFYDILLADINEAPVFEDNSKLLDTVDIDGVPDDDGNGVIVGQIDGFIDPDNEVSDPEGQDFRFTLNEIGAFNLDSATITATGEIFIGDRAQLTQNVEFEVTVIDSEGAESEPILIGVPADTANNDAPLVLDTTLERVNPSTAAIDNILGTVPSADPDGDPIIFSIDAGNDSGAFDINEDNGEISLVVDPATLTQGEFILTVTATDSVDNTLTDTAQVTIPVNTAPFLSSETVEIPENSGNDTVIALPLSDVDTPIGDLSVTLPSNQDNDFDDLNPFSEPVFNEETGQWEITITDSDELNLDFEEFSGFGFTVDLELSDGEIIVQNAIDVNLTDVNEAPTVEDAAFDEIDPRFIADGLVDGITVNDPEGEPVNLEITDGNDPDGNGIGAFAINAAGNITIADLTELTTTNFTLTVTATDTVDETLPSDTATVTIPIAPVPFIVDEPIVIDENREVAIPLDIGDADTNLADLSVTVLFGNQDNDFDGTDVFGNPQFNEINQQWELPITDSDELDFENFFSGDGITASVTTLELEASDETDSDTKLIDVSILDVNEAPVVEDEVFSSVDPTSAFVDQFVGTFSAFDPESDAFTLAITNGNDPDDNGTNAFNIDPSSETITIADPAELTQDFFILTVTATQDDDPSLTSSGQIVIPTPINPLPVANNVFTEIAETSANGTPIPLDITDANTNLADLTVNILNGNPDNDGDGINVFSDPVNPDGGEWQITVTDSDELNADDSFSLEIEATDDLGTNTATITVELDEAPTVDDAVLNSVDPNTASAGDNVEFISAFDPEGDAFTLAITDGNDPDGNGTNAFNIDPFGTITIADPAELTQDFFILTVTATQDDDPTLTSSGQIIIPTPTNPLPVINDSPIDLPENSAVLSLDIQDGNNLADLTVTLLDGNQDNDGDGVNVFSEVGEFVDGQLQLTVTDIDELFPNQQFDLEIEVSDPDPAISADLATVSDFIDVSITNVNEAPIVEDKVFNSFDPDSAFEGQLLNDTVSVTDPDGDSIAAVEITGGNPNADGDETNAFNITDEGEITVADPDEFSEEFQTSDFFILEVTATESNIEGLTGAGQVIIPAPIDPTPDINNSTIDLPENSAVLPLDIADGNNLADLTVTLLDGNQDNDGDGINVFSDVGEFVDGQWQLTVTDIDELDFELFPNQEFNLEIEATDPDVAISESLRTDTESLTVSLEDVNEIEDSAFTFDLANAQANPVVGTLSISEPDDGFGVNDVSIVDGNDPDQDGLNAFAIAQNLGEFQLIVDNLNELTETAFTLQVEAFGGGAIPGTAEITVDILSLRPVIDSEPLKLLEDSAEGDTVALKIRDQDTSPENLNVAVVAGNQDLDEDGQFAFGEPIFNSEFGQWEVPVNDTDDLDFETNQNFTLQIQVSDGATSAIGSPEIQLTDVNEAPIFEPGTFEVNVNDIVQQFEQQAPNLPVVGILEVEEPDLDQSATLVITGGNDPDGNEISAFAIQENAFGEFELVLENPEELTQDFILEITATDDSDAALSTTAEFIIDITAAPSFGEIDPLLENSPDGTVIPLGIEDADTPLDTLTVTLEGGNQDTDGDGRFAFSEPTFNPDTGEWELVVNDSDEFNFETNNEFILELEARDDTEVITVNRTLILEDVNEPPTVEEQTLEVNANEAIPFQSFEVIVADDPDDGQFVETLAITGGNDPDGNETNAFTVDVATKRLVVINPDELTQDFVLTVTATDSSEEGLIGTAQINVAVIAAPEVASNIIELPENSENGTVIPLDIQDLNTPTADLTVSLIAGNTDNDGDGIFAFSSPSFNPDSGQWQLTVTDSDELDFEDNNTFNLELQASDGERLGTGFPQIILTDVNEAPVAENVTLNLLNTADIAAGDVVGLIPIADPEEDSLDFAITAGNDPDGNGTNAFTINNEVGAQAELIILNPAEITGEFQLEVTATETETDEQNTASAAITIPIDTPPAFPDTEFSIPENSAVDAALGQVTVTEDQGVASLTISSPNFDGDDNPAFRIDVDGNLFVNDPDDFDFEANAGLLLGEVSATNINGLSRSETLTINIQDVNEIPTIEDRLFTPIPKGNASESDIPILADGDSVGFVTAGDPDIGENAKFDIIEGNNDADGDGTEALAIESNGEIIVTDAHDVQETFRLTVQVSDRGGDNNQGVAIVPVNGEGNQAPIAEDATVTIPENSANGSFVGTFPHTDPDFNNIFSQENLTFAITNGNVDSNGNGISAFSINRNSGAITVADSDDLDFEDVENQRFALTIEVSDLDGATDTAQVTVNLENVNEAPEISDRFLDRVTFNPITSVPDAVDGDVVGSIIANDPEGTALTFEIVEGNDPEQNLADAFAIDAQGQVTIANIEEIPETGFFSVVVAVTDETGLTTDTDLVIPLGTQAPTIEPDQSFTIPEDAAFETLVGTVLATEPDGEELDYFLVQTQQLGLPPFELDQETGELTVFAPNALDFEQTPTINLTAIARDPNQAIAVETVTVNLENVNEAPTFDEENFSFVIPASSQAGRGVGVVSAFDEDGDAVTYAIVGGNEDRDGDETGAFAIDENTGELIVADGDDLLTLEDDPFRLEVQARDSELNNTVEVDVAALPAAPIITNNGATFPINPVSFEGALVQTVEAFDRDNGELFFEITGGNTDFDADGTPPLEIDQETGDIIVIDPDDVADVEANPLALTVLVSDEEGDTTEGNFTITSGAGTLTTGESITFTSPLPEQSEAELGQDLNEDGDTEDIITPEPSNLVRPAFASTQVLSIENTGNAPLLISDVVVSEGLRDRVTTDFDALVEAATPVDDNGEALFDLPGVEIPVGANLELAVTYTPDAGGEVIDEAAGLTLFSNDPENGEVAVALFGESTFNSDISYNGSVGFEDVTEADTLFNTAAENLNPALNIDGQGGFGFSDIATLNQEFGAAIA